MSRLKSVHAKFLMSCRNLREGRRYWDQASGPVRWFLQLITPVPLLGLHQDGKRLLEALQWLESHCLEKRLDEDMIRLYHRMAYSGKEGEAGEYRKHPIAVVGSAVPRAAPQKVPTLMKQLDLRLLQEQERFDSMDRVDEEDVMHLAVDTHQKIGLIHPFADANGRVSRLAMNHLFRRYKMGYVIFPPLSESQALMDALQEAHAGKLEALLDIARKHIHHV